MPTYSVQITALAVVWRREEIEAASPEEAERKALKKYGRDEDGWELNGLFDGGSAVCKPEVTECEETEQESES